MRPRLPSGNQPRIGMPDDEIGFEVGQRVVKTGGDYTFEGEVIGRFTKRSGAVRYAVENNEGIIHIFNGKQLAAVQR